MAGRRLTAILAADIAGYSALMGSNDVDTVAALKGHQSVILPMISGYSGRVIDTAGDGVLAEFASVFNAVKCAVAIQEVMLERNASMAPNRRMQYRIGINQGDVLFDEDRIYGDGINIAARLEGLCEPGGICISGKVYEEIRGRFEIQYQDIGEQTLKNIAVPVRTYRISISGIPRTDDDQRTELTNKWLTPRWITAVSGLALLLASGGGWWAINSFRSGEGTDRRVPPAIARSSFDGFWEVTGAGGPGCGVKDWVGRIRIADNTVFARDDVAPGKVFGNGDFEYKFPNNFIPAAPPGTFSGKLSNGSGHGYYKYPNGCMGSITLKRL